MVRELKKNFIKIVAIAVVVLITVHISTSMVLAFFTKMTDEPIVAPSRLNVNDLFGSLDESVNPSGIWGSETNPYLISEERHLRNLYLLQNSSDSSVINENTFFQVSNEFGLPCYVGGASWSELLDIPSIGSEDFPFVSNLRGVTAVNSADYITLPNGEITDTSTLVNIRVTAYAGQTDIGLFGCVGKLDTHSAGGEVEIVGSITNLLLSDIQIQTNATGSAKDDHSEYFVSSVTHETNHIGILAGHAQFCQISDISVYYSNNAGKARVNAFDISEGQLDQTKYTTAGGILGYYKELVTDPDNAGYRVNSNGISDFGGSYVGLGQGIVYSEDIWTFMEKNYFGSTSASQREYGIQSTFDEALYGLGNTSEKYFQVGVFTFVHSTQMKANDRIAKLWRSDSDPISSDPDKTWSVSTSSAYQSSGVVLGEDVWADNSEEYLSKKYTCSSVTNGNVSSYTNSGGYRFMIVATVGSQQYALVKYGATTTHVKIDTNNLIIPQSQINYYTFRVSRSRSQSAVHPPYIDEETRLVSGYTYGASGSTALLLDTASSEPSSYTTQYLVYGNNVPASDYATSGRYVESERPLRIYYSSSDGGTISFMAAAATSSSTVDEAVKLRATSTNNSSNATFVFRRVSNGRTSAMYMSFSETNGFTGVGSGAVSMRVYAVKVTSGGTNPPQDADYIKQIYTPSSNVKSFDMSQNVLFYNGNGTNYNYDIVSIPSLNWAGNDGNAIDSGDTALKMADPTSYYYISSIFRGVLEDIPAPSGMAGTIVVPEASIGFNVRGTGTSGSTSKVFVIVATDPSQLTNQTITISYFSTSSNGTINGNRSVVSSFPLPAIPGSNASTTTAITVRDLTAQESYTPGGSYSGSSFTAYPNLNTLLIAYQFEVSSQYDRTYFLEASKGSANFVYLSAERTAAVDSNPEHENDVVFDTLSGIDYVFSYGGNVATVKSEDYVGSQIMPYFGLGTNPSYDANAVGVDALIVLSCMDFSYNIYRYYDAPTETYNLAIDITVLGYSSSITQSQLKSIISLMNFNFSDLPYTDPDTLERAYSDVVSITINSRLVSWASVYS